MSADSSADSSLSYVFTVASVSLGKTTNHGVVLVVAMVLVLLLFVVVVKVLLLLLLLLMVVVVVVAQWLWLIGS